MPENRGGEPNNIIFLTCDVSGVLPPVSLLSKAAAYHFLSVIPLRWVPPKSVPPKPTKQPSQPAGALLFPRPAGVYADLLIKRIEEFGSGLLNNTGWTGGGYGVGARFNANHPAIISAIQSGVLADAATTRIVGLNLDIPIEVPGVDTNLLNLATHGRTKAYDTAAASLISKFQENFAFCCRANIVAAGPAVSLFFAPSSRTVALTARYARCFTLWGSTSSMRLDEATIRVLGQPNVGLDQLVRGIEKESLRVSVDGSLSQLHFKSLGSALTPGHHHRLSGPN